MTPSPLVTVAVPSFNQGEFLEQALVSIVEQDLPVEIFVADGGSRDNSVAIIERWAPRLAAWRSRRDAGQAAAINECIAQGSAPYVYWLNSDDMLLPGGLNKLVEALERDGASSLAYGQVWNQYADGKRTPVWVEQYSTQRLARRCIISQPGTLVRRAAWEEVGGVDQNLHMALDYDLWWKLAVVEVGFHHLAEYVAVNRVHQATKTRTNRRLHYLEATAVVRKYYGRLPLKWRLWWPYAVWAKSIFPDFP